MSRKYPQEVFVHRDEYGDEVEPRVDFDLYLDIDNIGSPSEDGKEVAVYKFHRMAKVHTEAKLIEEELPQ